MCFERAGEIVDRAGGMANRPDFHAFLLRAAPDKIGGHTGGKK
jgi:hypothetical protein